MPVHPRISDISNAMEGSADSNYKCIQRFIYNNDPKEALHRLYNKDTEYVLGDPTDIERLQAKKTEYVGKLKSKKLGFNVLSLATPYCGRAIPFSFITYSSKTINGELSSRNMEHIKSIAKRRYASRDKAAYWDGLTQTGEKAASGIYFYVLKSGKFSASKKMVLIRYPERD